MTAAEPVRSKPLPRRTGALALALLALACGAEHALVEVALVDRGGRGLAGEPVHVVELASYVEGAPAYWRVGLDDWGQERIVLVADERGRVTIDPALAETERAALVVGLREEDQGRDASGVAFRLHAADGSLVNEIVVPPLKWVRGTVTSPESAPVADAVVSARTEGVHGYVHARTNPTGRFVLGPLLEQEARLSARDRAGAWLESEDVLVDAHQQVVDLALQRGGRIEVRLAGEVPVRGEHLRLQAFASSQGVPVRTGFSGYLHTSRDPVKRTSVLAPGEYGVSLHTHPLELGGWIRMAWTTCRVEADEVTEVELMLEPARRVELRVARPEAWLWFSLSVEGTPVFVDAIGDLPVVGVAPDRPVELWVQPRGDGPPLRRTLAPDETLVELP